MESDATTVDQIAGAMAQHQVTVRACDSCRRKKVRCELTAQGCAQCTKCGIDCHFSPVVARRKTRRPAGYKYISELEERVRKMEKLLGDSLKTLGPLNMGEDSQWQERRVSGTPHGLDGLEPEISSAVAADLEKNLDKDPNITGRTATAQERPREPYRYAAPNLGPFSRATLQQLPASPAALELVREMFKSFNRYFPLFDEEDFMREFQIHYSTSSPQNPVWWACINVVLAMAHLFRGMRPTKSHEDNMRACGYVHNALTVISELNFCYHNISAVQALIGMAIILQGTPNPGSSALLTGSAMRLAQTMKLHREPSLPSMPTLTDAQSEQRRRVFWLAYILDKDISIRMGQPFLQDDDDMDVNLPKTDAGITHQDSGQTPCLKLLNHRISLAVIQGQVYKQLHSVQAQRQTKSQKALVAQELFSLLAYWRSAVGTEFLEESATLSAHQLSDKLIHQLIMRLEYLHCLTLINRHLPPEATFSGQDFTFSDTWLPPQSLCLTESRAAIRLTEVIPHGNNSCVWILLHPLFAAVTTVLSHIARYPASPQAQADLQLVQPFLRLLETLAQDKALCARSVESERLQAICKELASEAERALQLSGYFGMEMTSTSYDLVHAHDIYLA